MALAEARAAWQRTANRCLVQEDAKRAPRLACCSSGPPSAKQDETGPTSPSSTQDIPSSNSSPFNRNPSYPNLSPNSRWWLQRQPNYLHQQRLMDDHITPLEGNIEKSEDDLVLVDQTSDVEFPFDNQYRSFMDKKDFKDENLRSVYNWNSQDSMKLGLEEDFKEVKDEGFASFEVSKNSNDLYFDSESSWVGVEKNTPWWRTADSDELALFVAQRSVDFLENCDLPMPRNTRMKKNLSSNARCLSRDDMSASLPVHKTGIGSHHHLYTHNSAPASLTAGSSCQKLKMGAEDKLLSGSDKPLRESLKPELHASDEDARKAKLLEALRHSQTRAREAEKVARQACADKEHVVKLVFRQASQLFAYKQWLHLLQLENMYFQFKNNKSLSATSVFPENVPWTTLRTRKTRKDWLKPLSRKGAKRARPQFDVGKCAIVFALGLGLVGAGLLLGWSVGWMLPTW